MRKRIRAVPTDRTSSPADGGWLNLSEIATVEVSSEQDGFPVEAVFMDTAGPGWRASGAGPQVIRILFDEPMAVHRIRLRFQEPQAERTQEFTLRWCPQAGGSREIVRQQWNFSPAGSTAEIEDYAVSLEAVSALELVIVPDIGSEKAVATLAMWRVAGRDQSCLVEGAGV
jgi:Anaphase-promoting complex, subunit 10 (APC10)